jgi:hypothetical protein
VLVLPGYVAARVRMRGGDETLAARVLYVVVPVLDAKSAERRSLTPRAFVLWLIGMVIVVIYMFVHLLTL